MAAAPSNGEDPLTLLPTGLKLLLKNLHSLIPHKLDDTNYPSWYSTVYGNLSAHRLLGYVDGSLTAPPATVLVPATEKSPAAEVTNPAYDLWDATDGQLRACLLAVISPAVQKHLFSLSTSKEIWDHLHTRYNSLSRTHIFQLKDKLHQIQKGQDSMQVYLDKVTDIITDLHRAGEPISEGDVLLCALRGLPSEYAAIKQNIRTNLVTVTFNQASSWLLSEELNIQLEQKLHVSGVGSSSEPTALYASSGRGGQRGRGTGYRGRGGRQHYGRGSPGGRGPTRDGNKNSGGRTSQPSGGRYQGNDGRSSIQCQICGKFNHAAWDCWHRFDSEYSGPQTVGGPQAFYTSHSAGSDQNWYLDTGANTHVTSDLGRFSSSTPYYGTTSVTSAGGHPLSIAHTGQGHIQTPSGIFFLDNLLHVPSLKSHLLSVHQFTKDNNCTLIFNSKEFHIVDNHTNQVKFKGRCEQGLYALPPSSSVSFSSPPVVRAVKVSPLQWHCRLGHPSKHVTQSLLSSFNVPFNSDVFHCDACSMSKSHKLPFPVSYTAATAPFQLIHSDVWGPTSVPSFGGFHYYICFIDDFTKYCWLYPLKQKSDAYASFLSFQSMVQNQFGSTIKIFRTDNGREYVNAKFCQFLQQLGVLHHKSCPYTPEQNGVAERKHRHLVETLITLLYTASLPATFWVEALASANFLINRLPKRSLNNISPFEALYHTPPDYTTLRVFGCLVYPCLRHELSHKLAPRSKRCIFLGYEPLTKGFRCFDPLTQRVYVSRHVEFCETEFPYASSVSPISSDASPTSFLGVLPLFPSGAPRPAHNTPAAIHHPSPPHTVPHTPTPSITQHNAQPDPQHQPANHPQPEPHPQPAPHTQIDLTTQPETIPPVLPSTNTHSMATRSKRGIFKPKTYAATIPYDTSPTHEPSTYKEASQNKYWCTAMDEEFDALLDQRTWVLVPPPSDRIPIGCKWVYKIKRNSDGSVSRYKARLVAKGYNQEYGLDYSETFSPVVKQQSIRIVLSLALHFGWSLHQLDVSNAFLHGELEDVVYMQQPPGYIDQSAPHYVCKLQKSLYGLKQAPRAWYHRLSAFLFAQGFTITEHDPSLFVQLSPHGVLILLVYVDDIIITGSSHALVQSFITRMHGEFQMKNLGDLKYFLGIEVQHSDTSLLLHQTKYARELIHRAGVDDCKPMPTPVTPSSNTNGADEPFDNPRLFRSLVGGLHYLTVTRPDIQLAVNMVAQRMHAPTVQDFHQLKRILRYIKGTLFQGLVFRRGDLQVRAYSDADWANDPIDSRSVTGYLVYLGDNLISWSTQKQPRVSKSSTEAEYRALSDAASEVMWITYILSHLGQRTAPPILYCDNLSAICLTKNPVFHKRMKHVAADCNFVREQVTDGLMKVEHVSSEYQLADFLTKPLASHRYQWLISKLPIASATLSLRGDVRQ